MISYIVHHTPDVVCLQEVWADFPLECLVGLPYTAVVSTPFRGGGLVVLFQLSRYGGWVHTSSSRHVLCVCAHRGTSTNIACRVHPFAPSLTPAPRREVCTAAARFLRGSQAVIQVLQGDLNASVHPRGGGSLSKELQSGAWQFLSYPYDD